MGLQHTLKALSDPTRREILELLKSSKLSAGEICGHFNITSAAISRHLSILKEADLVRDEREGKYIFYEINLSVFQEILTWIEAFRSNKHSPSSIPSSMISPIKDQ